MVSPNQPTNFNHTARLRALPPSMALSTFVAGYHSTADSQPCLAGDTDETNVKTPLGGGGDPARGGRPGTCSLPTGF